MTMPIPKLSHALLMAAALMSLPARADSTGEVIGRWRDSDGVSEIAISPSLTIACKSGRNRSIFSAVSTMVTMIGRSDEVKRCRRWMRELAP